MSIMDALAQSALYDELTRRIEDNFMDVTSQIEHLNRRLMGIIEALDTVDARLQNIQNTLYDSKRKSEKSN